MSRPLGFTGTQRGMSIAQYELVGNILQDFGWEAFHHGDCIGADAQAHALAVERYVRTVIHPPVVDAKRAHCRGDETLPPRPYLDRNHDIVDASSALIATPGEPDEQLRSGTWATIRYARKKGKPVLVITPDGSLNMTKGWPLP